MISFLSLSNAKKWRQTRKKSRVSARIHDHTQVELRFNYRPIVAREKFFVTTHFIFPYQIQIRDYFSKDSFYLDLRNDMRFALPLRSFSEILHGGEDQNLIHLDRLAPKLASLSSDTKKVVYEDLKRNLKILAGQFNAYLSHQIDDELTLLDGNVVEFSQDKQVITQLEEQAKHLNNLLDEATNFLEILRQTLNSIPMLNEKPIRKMREEARYIDEYVTYTFVDELLRLSSELSHYECLADIPEWRHLQEKIVNICCVQREEIAKKGFIWIGVDSSLREREKALNQRRFLKRHILGALFLELKNVDRMSFLEHFGGMIAASLAAFWALIANILIFKYMNITSIDDFTKNLGIQGVIAVSAVVMAYVLKDRIKDLGKIYFRRNVAGKLYDHRKEILYRAKKRAVYKVATLLERVKLTDVRFLDEKLFNIWRNIYHDTPGSKGFRPQVISYKRQIIFNREQDVYRWHREGGIQDLIRFKIDRLLPKLDEPSQQLYTLDNSNHVQKIKVPKLYYLDLAVEINSTLPDQHNLNYFRIAISKRGIERLERIRLPQLS